MGRRRTRIPLNIFMNNHLVGCLTREASGSITFAYDPSWLARDAAVPLSLSLPLREDRYIGAPVSAVFENLLPDSESMRRHIAERVGAEGRDAYSLLAKIGRDCVGALQFIPEGEELPSTDLIQGTVVNEAEIERMLRNLVRSPLGMGQESDFRISLAGVQEKTALLLKEGKWLKPHGITPTTHIFKTQIGHLPNGIDLSHSVENEFYCLKLLEAFGLSVNSAHMERFGSVKALVIERFDRYWTKDGRLLRLPQEDFCQALALPPTLKYQDQGGPGIVDIMTFLQGSDEALKDQIAFLKCQIIFWLISATDGHGKNFSLFLAPGGRYKLTPFYDVLSAQPSVDAHYIEMPKLKLAMSVGDARHYKLNDINGRHFVQSGERSGLSKPVIHTLLHDIIERAPHALEKIEKLLPHDFPESIHASIQAAVKGRIKLLQSV